MKILVAEDEPAIQQMISVFLSRRNFPFIMAENGARALEIWEAEEIDMILMDLQMPDISGIETTRRIRETERTRGGHVPIIGLTAWIEERKACLAAGMDDFVSKPLNFRSLEAVLNKYERTGG